VQTSERTPLSYFGDETCGLTGRKTYFSIMLPFMHCKLLKNIKAM